MALPTSGTISISDVSVELLRAPTATTSLNEEAVRSLANILSGTISLSNLYGKSFVIPTGYFAGGQASSGVTTEIDSIRFSTETSLNTSASLSAARSLLSGISSPTKGYFSSTNNALDGVNFATETAFNTAAFLTPDRQQPTSVNSLTRGYLAGGTVISQPVLKTIEITGIDFASETMIDPSAGLAYARGQGMAGVSSTLKGYFACGVSGFYAPTYYGVDGIVFNNESAFTTGISLPAVLRYRMASYNSSTRGYFVGGSNSVYVNTSEIDGIDFSTDTYINPAASLVSPQKSGLTGVNSTTSGYAAGGNTAATTFFNNIERMLFSTETNSQISATLVLARTDLAGVQSGAL